MEKTRVNKDERYWYVCFDDEDGGIVASMSFDDYTDLHDVRNRIGNYFHIKEEAEIMVRKLRAVLNGADVIEMPSEGEIEDEAYENNHIHKERGDCNYPDDLCIESFIEGVNWFKSKIVK